MHVSAPIVFLPTLFPLPAATQHPEDVSHGCHQHFPAIQGLQDPKKLPRESEGHQLRDGKGLRGGRGGMGSRMSQHYRGHPIR